MHMHLHVSQAPLQGSNIMFVPGSCTLWMLKVFTMGIYMRLQRTVKDSLLLASSLRYCVPSLLLILKSSGVVITTNFIYFFKGQCPNMYRPECVYMEFPVCYVLPQVDPGTDQPASWRSLASHLANIIEKGEVALCETKAQSEIWSLISVILHLVMVIVFCRYFCTKWLTEH